MKSILRPAVLLISLLAAGSIFAATPEAEKTFIDTFKKAFEAKDEKTLVAFLYKEGADPQAVEFFTMMLTGDAGNKITSIELVALTPEELKKLDEPQPMPGGGNAKLNVKPYKKLVLKTSSSDANGSSTSSSEIFIAEKDGKLVIPVPAPVK